MIQDLEGIDIYHSSYFNIDSKKKLVFAKGQYVNRPPDSFKTISEIYNIIRYCMWIIKQKDIEEINKYAAIVYMNKVNKRFNKIESEYRKILKETQTNNDKNLKKSIDKPGKTYI